MTRCGGGRGPLGGGTATGALVGLKDCNTGNFVGADVEVAVLVGAAVAVADVGLGLKEAVGTLVGAPVGVLVGALVGVKDGDFVDVGDEVEVTVFGADDGDLLGEADDVVVAVLGKVIPFAA